MSTKYMYSLIFAIEENNIEKVKTLLSLKKENPAYNKNYVIGVSAEAGCLDIVKLLLEDSRVDPSDDNNYAIKLAHKNKYTNIVEILWNEKCVKNTLKQDNLELYNNLMRKDIKNKVDEF